MANYLFAYHGGQEPESEQDYAAVMAAWQSWLTEFGSSVVDGGNPVGPNFTVQSDGTIINDGGKNSVSGYGIFKAESSDQAIEIAKGCPILAAGGSVEVAEIFDLSQSG